MQAEGDIVQFPREAEAPPPPAESCISGCHNGIEDPHPWFGGEDLTCTGCHGGDATATGDKPATDDSDDSDETESNPE